jgi:hypothetical protein
METLILFGLFMGIVIVGSIAVWAYDSIEGRRG